MKPTLILLTHTAWGKHGWWKVNAERQNAELFHQRLANKLRSTKLLAEWLIRQRQGEQLGFASSLDGSVKFS